MQKWEYLSITARMANDEWRPQFREGEELMNWESGPKLNEYLNVLGEQGWELVSETFDGVTRQWSHIYTYIDAEMKKWEANIQEWSSKGWELAGTTGYHTAGGAVSDIYLFFKRPVSDSMRRLVFKRPMA